MGASCSCCCQKPTREIGTNEYGMPCKVMEDEEVMLDSKKQRGGARKGKEGRIGAKKVKGGDTGEGEPHLASHKRKRNKGKETKKLIRTAMKADRVCALLEEKDIETILETMEYFEFKAKEPVVKQGDVGTTFFVTHEGQMEVSVNNKVVNTMSRGRAFGGLALLYNCPRTASVTSMSASSAWGANGDTFHKVLQENAKSHYVENRKFLDSIKLFDGLAVKQKDRVGEAFFVEAFDAGSRVVTEGESATAMYFVKKGKLRVLTAAKIQANGKVSGGTEIAKLEPGECFGERGLLYQEERASTVVAEERCELLVISGELLREVLGSDLRSCLERNLILTGLKKSPIISHFSPAQQGSIGKAVEIQDIKANQSIPSGLRFVVVIDGEVKGMAEGKEKTVLRGGCYEQDAFLDDGTAERSDKKSIKKASEKDLSQSLMNLEKAKGTFKDVVAGRGGARIGVLQEKKFRDVLKELGLDNLASNDQVLDHTRKTMLAKKVHILRHLSSEQIQKLVCEFKLHRLKKGEAVCKQGEIGDKFYVIAEGEVRVTIGDKFIRTMAKNGFFGERALLFEEPRSATIEVTTIEGEFWSIDKATFSTIVQGKMMEDLMRRIRLQDTSVTMKDLLHIKVIGAGAAGVVRLVEHKATKTRYALKRVMKVKGKIPEEVTRECELLAENDHPFIMHLVKTFETTKSVYILTELITGGELHAAIRAIPTVLSRAQCQFYGGSLILVLEELADRNILFRDLKPENVMLDQQGYLKLIDFGIAKKLEEGKTRTFTMIGTPHYMAPEVMRGHGYGTEVDIWSFGVMVFEFVCGYLPFADELEDPTEVCTAVLKDPFSFPSGYRDQHGRSLMTGLLSRNPKKRLGAGMNGFEDIKGHEYFKIGHTSTASLFSKIIGRELDPPVVPPKETYCNPEDVADIALSDADELG
mmetsp:Transcript_134223/g.233219  ORF Transcript_134223/g.233219 Transcript_134223/m.233219 type:complete len:926 (+) Transcript_134223:259-3036(+)